ncbi:DUF1515 domain-containing protein [Pseudorhizobium endolithicum]|nr:DUF1515 domain-containing protein [Pseudorhizobium endolithicum]
MPGSNDDILRVLGRVEEGIHRLREDFQEEKRSARESRSEIHKRLDKHADEYSRLDSTIILTGQTVAQQRDVISELTKVVEKDVMPTIKEVKEIKALGKRASMIFIGLGFTAGGTFIWFSDLMITGLRKWLRID